jgi:hypothetical protein
VTLVGCDQQFVRLTGIAEWQMWLVLFWPRIVWFVVVAVLFGFGVYAAVTFILATKQNRVEYRYRLAQAREREEGIRAIEVLAKIKARSEPVELVA